jgi:hypothetical protein
LTWLVQGGAFGGLSDGHASSGGVLCGLLIASFSICGHCSKDIACSTVMPAAGGGPAGVGVSQGRIEGECGS